MKASTAEKLYFACRRYSTVDRTLPIDPRRHGTRLSQPTESPDESRVIKTVLLGLPNSGKSKLTNALIDAEVCPVSSKVHTTRYTTTGSTLLNGRTQLIALDTPGLVTSLKAKKHNLESSLLNDPMNASNSANTALVVVDASDEYNRRRLDARVLHALYLSGKQLTSALVLNKIDLVKDRGILLNVCSVLTKGMVGGRRFPSTKPKNTTGTSTIDTYADSNVDEDPFDAKLKTYWTTVKWSSLKNMALKPWSHLMESELQACYAKEDGWPLFEKIFMTSALTGEGVEEIREYLNERAIVGDWQYDPSVVTDMPPTTVVKNLVRAQLLECLKYHMPYTLKYEICVWEVNAEDVLCIRLDVVCPHERDIKFVVGGNGSTVKRVAQTVAQQLRNLFQREVFLRIGARVSGKSKSTKNK